MMALDLKHIQERMDAVFKKYRNKGLAYDKLLLLKEFGDDVYNDLVMSDKKAGKNKNNRSKHTEAQIKMIQALKMNNPLWDVE